MTEGKQGIDWQNVAKAVVAIGTVCSALLSVVKGCNLEDRMVDVEARDSVYVTRGELVASEKRTKKELRAEVRREVAKQVRSRVAALPGRSPVLGPAVPPRGFFLAHAPSALWRGLKRIVGAGTKEEKRWNGSRSSQHS
jgi:hypothetical protein